MVPFNNIGGVLTFNQKIKKREKPEDFIGWKSPDGKLEVVGIHKESVNGKATTFKVICTDCSKDIELFPHGFFVGRKCDLMRGKKPCGCSKRTMWEGWQFLILARRAAKNRFIVHGFSEPFKNAKTKLSLECLKDGSKWTASINHIINNGYGCPKCKSINSAEQKKTPEHIALQKCIDVCKEMNYNPVGFVNSYKNNKSCFEYICKIHGKQSVSYNNFVDNGRRCSGCSKAGYDPNKQGSFYIIQWTKDDHNFIKFGITNRNLSVRVEEQASNTAYYPTVLFSKTWGDGYIPLRLEKSIKSSGLFKIGVVSKENFEDGFTETTDYAKLDNLLCYVRNWLKEEI